MRRPRLKSTFARAVVPVAAGLGFFVLLGLALWAVAALISHNSSQASAHLTPPTQEMGSTSLLASQIASDGPIVLQDLVGNDSHVVVDHTGSDHTTGWAMYLAHPADKPATCLVAVVKHTRTFTDCTGRVVTVAQLATVPEGVGPILSNDGSFLTLDLTPTGA